MKTLPLFLLLSLFLLSCSEQKQSEKTPSVHLVKTMTVSADNQLVNKIYPGIVVAGSKVDLAFQVPGKVIEFPVVEGKIVDKDELLAKLDNRDYKNTYYAELAKLTKAQQDLRRAEELLKSGTIPVAEYDKRKAQHDVSVANTKKAKKAFDDTTLIAPYSGLIAKTYIENYQDVNAKESILALQDINQVDIVIHVPEQDLIQIQQINKKGSVHGSKVKGIIIFDALPEREFEAIIKEYATEADPVTQTYKITLSMPRPSDMNVLPGMTTNLITQDRKTGKILYHIPISATAIDDDGNYYVWKIDQTNQRVKKALIKVGKPINNGIQVIDGLKAGDVIVTAGVDQLQENDKIRIKS